MNTALRLGLEAANGVCSSQPNVVGLLKLDLSRPTSIRLRAGEFWISAEDMQLIRELRRSGAVVRFDLVPSGMVRRFVPLDAVVVNAEGRFSTAQVFCVSPINLEV